MVHVPYFLQNRTCARLDSSQEEEEECVSKRMFASACCIIGCRVERDSHKADPAHDFCSKNYSTSTANHSRLGNDRG